MNRMRIAVLLLGIGALLTACSTSVLPAAPPAITPTLPPATVAVAAPATPGPTGAAALASPDPGAGLQVWQSKPCVGCHGANAGGNTGPALAGTGLTFDAVLLRVRVGKGSMPAFTTDHVSDIELRQIHAWLRSLSQPTPTAEPSEAPTAAPTKPPATAVVSASPVPAVAATQSAPTATPTTADQVVASQPTPIPPPDFPTAALSAFWATVNDLKVKSDFTKDLPARQAQDDAGRLSILKGYAGEAVGLGQQALGQGNQALAEISRGTVQADLRQALAAVQQIVDQANQALGRANYGEAYQNASAMARLSRIEAWPWATQAVRDAGLTGAVRVRVTNRAGQPIANAFVTVLTAHDPAAALTDATGRATIRNAAAVPALQVKAYAAGLVYHEVHVNLTPGATADAVIALPGANPSGQAPAVSSATAAAGSGGGAISLRMTASDPQGATDLAEDQLFALNPALGTAFVLQAAGGGQYAAQVQLPAWATGPQTWHFFAVDHACNTSNVVTRQFPAP